MKKLLIISICFLMSVALISCEDQTIGYGSVAVDIVDDNNSKTVTPSNEDLTFSKYKIIGKHSDEKVDSIEKEFSDKSVKIDYLTIGEWKFYVEGYNKDGKLLAKSEPKEVLIEAGKTSNTRYVLDWIKGGGKLRLSIKVQTSKVDYIECTLYRQDNDTNPILYKVDKKKSESDGGLYSFEGSFDVPSGFYNSEIVMKNTDGLQIGVTLHPSVHIYNEFESYYNFSWEKLQNLLPAIDTPKPDIAENDCLYCNSAILLRTEEENTQIYYSFYGSENYTRYKDEGIKIPDNLIDSIKLNVRAEKNNLTASEVKSFTYQIKHKATYKAKNDATCLESGNVEYWECDYCKKKFKEETCETVLNSVKIPALGHKEVKHEAKSATCEEIGWNAYVTCSRCEYSTYEEIKALGHSLKHHDAKEPTCTEVGYDAYDTCLRCTYTTYVEKPKLGHDFINHDAVGPTCVNDGCREYVTCSRCSYTTYEKIEALGHDKIKHDSQEATCTEKGWNAYITCKRCDYTTYNEIPAKGHSSEHLNRIEPTCTKNGNVEYWHCNTCNKDFGNKECDTELESIIVPALGHNLEKIKEKEPTCTEAGYLAYEACSKCDYTTYKEKPALGHAEVKHDAKPATCEGIGWNAYVTCSRCEYSTYEEIKALGHSLEHHDAKDPTCTEIGYSSYETCSRCNYTTRTDIPAKGHSAVHHDMVVATCTTKGNIEYWNCSTCKKNFIDSKCENESSSVYTPSLGHDYQNYRCTRCNVLGYGPSGGRIIYDCDADNGSDGTEAGPDGLMSSVCRWRFIEQTSQAISQSCVFGCKFVTGSAISSGAKETGIGFGRSNTEKLVESMGDNAWIGGADYTDNYAAKLAYDYSITNNGHTFSDWYLPSYEELKLINKYNCWSSTEYSSTKAYYYSPGKTDERLTTYKTVYGVRYFPENEPYGHDFTSSVLQDLECTQDEITRFTCNNCGYSYDVTSAKATGHSLSHFAGIDPTCTKEGNVEYWHCNTCNKDFENQEGNTEIASTIVPALDHNLTFFESKKPTCTEPGHSAYETCSRCDYTTYKKLDATGHDYQNFKCSNCETWFIGPAGGYVFYDCDADNNTNGTEAGPDGLVSTECGWRYLEAAPDDISVEHSGDYGIRDLSTEGHNGYAFGLFSLNPYESNRFVNKTTTYSEEDCTRTEIGYGLMNTNLLVSTRGNCAYATSNTSVCYEVSDCYAAKVCYDYSIEKNGLVFDDWFLPSKDELLKMYEVFSSENVAGFLMNGDDTSYWSSSEYPEGLTPGNAAWFVDFEKGEAGWGIGMSSRQAVRAIRAFSENEPNGHTFVIDEVLPTCSSFGSTCYTCSFCGFSYRIDSNYLTEHVFVNGECSTCDVSYSDLKEGGKGLYGGYIFYDCDYDNEYGNNDGLESSICGWRFAEVYNGSFKGNYISLQGIPYDFTTSDEIGSSPSNISKIKKENNDRMLFGEIIGMLQFTVGNRKVKGWSIASINELSAIYNALFSEGIGNLKSGTYSSSTIKEWRKVQTADFQSGSYKSGYKEIYSSDTECLIVKFY